MFEIDKIPASVYDSMAAKGVTKEDILLGAYCDRNREHEPQDVYLLATSKELWVLFGVFAGKHSHSGHHHYETAWEEADADKNHNPIETEKNQISWLECVQQVLTAYANFSPSYALCAAEIINSNTIDAKPGKGKNSGAYCTRGVVPYILMNFTGDPDDASTFSHELGHGVHHVLSAQVGTLNDSTPTALAEVASEFAEHLLFKQRLENAQSDKEKLSMLISYVQRMISSIHRQISFYKFEERTHRERKKGELSTARLNQIWREETSRYLGFDVGEDAECLWMGIPHIFGTPYYVYSYAFAGLVVNNLIKAYETWDENHEFGAHERFDELYIDMLSNTGIEHFKSLLEPFGIDADSPDFWADGLSLITDYIEEIEKLAKKEGLL